MLLPRFLTALLGVPILLLSIWWGQIPFVVLIFGVTLLSLYEFYSLAEEASWPVSKRAGLACGAVLAVTLALFGTRMGWEKIGKAQLFFSPAILSVLLVVLILSRMFSRDKENAFLDVAFTWLGLFYVVWNLLHILLIRDLRPAGKWYTFFLFIVIWILDVGAYFGGMKFGNRKLAENISPKKTWEGAAIGSLAALLAAILCKLAFLKNISVLEAMGLAGLIIVFSQFSDLSESLFKRNVNVKDSGNLLPGHGGILDRFDSFLLTTPLYYYALVLWIR